MMYAPELTIAIAGRNKDTVNYERALRYLGVSAFTTTNPGQFADCAALLLPGGGDITPAFFGQRNQGSRNIDTELDIIQLQALDLFLKWERPVLGICKGMQIINVYFGGTVIQDLPEAEIHAWNGQDRIHSAESVPDSILDNLYGRHCLINSAHHQGIDNAGRGLTVIQTASDGVIEGLCHETMPVLGVQWHPERLFQAFDNGRFTSSVPGRFADGQAVFSYFLSLCCRNDV